MRKMYQKFFVISKLFDSDIIDKKLSRKINWVSILSALPVMLIYALIMFTTCTVYIGVMPIIKIVICFMPLFVCLFFGLVSLFTIQLYKEYLPDHETIQNVNNFKFFLIGLINPIVVIFTFVIVILMCIIL